MYLFYTDEVNLDPRSSDFFIYAGVSIPGQTSSALSEDIDRLRKKYGYRPGDLLKFNTRERPEHISSDIHREIKREVMESASRHGVKFFASFILHDVATSPEEARLNEIGRICYHFDCYLSREEDCGIVLLDTFQDKDLTRVLRERSSVGITGFPYSKEYRLKRVLGYHLCSVGTSHFCSISDIAIGGLRYAVNQRADSAKRETSAFLLKQISSLCIKEAPLNNVSELSVFFSPKSIRVAKYRAKYTELREFLKESGIDCCQEIR